MAWQMKIAGLGLAQELRQLAEALGTKAMNTALLKAAEPVRARAAQKLPHSQWAPHIADNIVTMRLPRSQCERDMDVPYGVAIGPAYPFFYGYLLEFGWKYYPSGHPFMRPAFDETYSLSLQLLSQELWAQIRAAKGKASGPSAGGTGTL